MSPGLGPEDTYVIRASICRVCGYTISRGEDGEADHWFHSQTRLHDPVPGRVWYLLAHTHESLPPRVTHAPWYFDE